MSYHLCKTFVLICSIHLFGQGSPGFLPLLTEQNSFASDIVLLYQQGYVNEQLSKKNLLSYIVYENKNTKRKQWLFDGFLFITAIDNQGYQYTNVGKNKSAKKREWEKVIEWNFRKDYSIDGIDKIIDEYGDESGYPIRKRKIFLSIPEPIKNRENWGALDGKKLDFHYDQDRIAACKWFISRNMEEWKKLNPTSIELGGFYWITEYAKESELIIKEIKSILNVMELKLIWIPYWGASGSSLWHEMGFDATYIQPNYFFSPEINYERLEDACNFAFENGMGLEFEFDKNLFKNKSIFLPRFNSYLFAFLINSVFNSASITYYQNGLTIKDLSDSNDPEYRDLYDSLCTYILLRQRIADNIYLGIK